MRNPLHQLTLLFLSVLVLGSCVEESRCDSDSSRVLLVYIGTDNNLSGLEQAKLQNLRDGWTGKENDRLIAYIDKGKGADARLIELSNLNSTESPREIAVYGKENSASSSTLNRVIKDVMGMYPADSYGLLVFSHASGWLPKGTFAQPEKINASKLPSRSIMLDGTDEMELADFAAAIPDGLFDYIVFEACFMAGIEVAYELRHKTPVILASSAEIIDPGFAPVYSSATKQLFGVDLAKFGEQVFNYTLTYPEDNPQRSATYSVIRTAGLEELANFVRANCDFGTEVTTTDVQHFDRNSYHLFFDFEDYYARLLDSDAERSELSRLVSACVPWKTATETFMTQSASYNGFRINRHSGLTTYIPQPRFPGLNEMYKELAWGMVLEGHPLTK